MAKMDGTKLNEQLAEKLGFEVIVNEKSGGVRERVPEQFWIDNESEIRKIGFDRFALKRLWNLCLELSERLAESQSDRKEMGQDYAADVEYFLNHSEDLTSFIAADEKAHELLEHSDESFKKGFIAGLAHVRLNLMPALADPERKDA